MHFVKNEVGKDLNYPFTPGHEMAGIVTAVGNNVMTLKIGDKVAVGQGPVDYPIHYSFTMNLRSSREASFRN